MRCAWRSATRRSMASPACRTSQARHRILDVYDEARRAGDLTVRVYAGIPVAGPPLPQDLLGARRLSKRYEDDAC